MTAAAVAGDSVVRDHTDIRRGGRREVRVIERGSVEAAHVAENDRKTTRTAVAREDGHVGEVVPVEVTRRDADDVARDRSRRSERETADAVTRIKGNRRTSGHHRVDETVSVHIGDLDVRGREPHGDRRKALPVEDY
jgi:hypothetical protein